MPASARKRSTRGRTQTTNGRTNNRSGKDAISLLKQDHAKVRQLFKRLESSAQRGGGEDILNQIATELKIHTQIEEEIFYPAFREAVEGKKDEHLYYEAIEEHHVVDMVMPEAKATEEGSVEFQAKGKVLKDLVEHHADEEETSMFPKARRAMSATELRELGDRLQRRKTQLMGGGRLATMLKPLTKNRRRAA